MKPKKKVNTPPLAITASAPINSDIDREELADQLRIYRGSVETSRGILENFSESKKKTPNLSDGEEMGKAMVANIADAEGLAPQPEEPLAKRTEEKSRGNIHFTDENPKNQVQRLTKKNSAQADNLQRRGEMVADLSTQLAGQCDQPTPKPHSKPIPMDTSEESEKEGSLKRSKASTPTTTAPQFPPNQQANGPGKPSPAEYYKTEDGRYGCLKCASSYKHKSTLNQHKKYECGVQAQFQCADCLRKFKQKSHLKFHIANKSCHNRCNSPAIVEYYKTENGRYGCLKCRSSFKRKYGFNQHKKYQCGVEAQFQCADCLRKFKRNSHLKRHIVNKSCHNLRNDPAEYYKTEDGRYGCLKCGTSYKHKYAVNQHKKYECGVQPQFQCANCLKKFKQKSNLKTHIVNKSCHNRRNKNYNGPVKYYKREDGRYGCLKCASSYKYKRNFNQHKKYECGAQALFQCANCLKKFKHKSNLETHIVTKICHNRGNKNYNDPAEYYKTEDGKYGCLQCGSSYKHKSSFNEHKKYECGVQPQFQCADCLRKFKRKRNLKSHIAIKNCHNRGNNDPAEYYNTEDGRYGCLKCRSSYKHKYSLYRHKRYECGVQIQFQCANCLRKFKQKSNLKTHIVTKICHNRGNKNYNDPAEYYKTEDGKYGCLQCGSSYKHKSSFNEHKKYECGVQPQFQCEDCLRKFKRKRNLKSHIAIKNCHNRGNNDTAEYYNTEDGRYGCLKCRSSYKHKYSLYRHKRYECGVQTQFQCANCLRKFKQKSNLKTHIVTKICHNR